MMEVISIATFHERLRTQGAPAREDIAFKCVICGTVQSARSLIAAGAGATMDEVEKFLGFSCVGRWTNAGPAKRSAAPGAGCDWTLGGLFRLHKLEIEDEDGHRHPRFEVASAEECAALVERPFARQARAA